MDITALKDIAKEFGSVTEPDMGAEHQSEATEPKARYSSEHVPLFNAATPQVELKREKPQHRLVAILKASGLANTEIAELTGYTSTAVGIIVNQPHAREIILGRMHSTGDNAMQLLQEASVAAAERLIEIAETSKNDECRRKANNDILDRKYGKPNQPYSVAHKTASEMSDPELAKIAQGN